MNSNRKIDLKRATHQAKAVMLTHRLLEFYPIPASVENSYVLSSIWAWFSRIQTQPELRVPVPRILTTRDP